MVNEKQKKAKALKSDWSLIPIGIVIAAIGACFIAFSSVVEYLALAVGIFVIVGATVLATTTLLGKRSGALFVLKIIFSACILAAGIITIVFMDYVASIICVVFAGVIAIDGSIKLGTSIMAKQYSVASRTVMLIFALITTASALAMVRFTPDEINDDNLTVASVIIGITFILDAICNMISPFLKKSINDGIISGLETKDGTDEICQEPAALSAPEQTDEEPEYEADYSEETVESDASDGDVPPEEKPCAEDEPAEASSDASDESYESDGTAEDGEDEESKKV